MSRLNRFAVQRNGCVGECVYEILFAESCWQSQGE
jgi:hypothetical protein